jgi:hypothetical protein
MWKKGASDSGKPRLIIDGIIRFCPSNFNSNQRQALFHRERLGEQHFKVAIANIIATDFRNAEMTEFSGWLKQNH